MPVPLRTPPAPTTSGRIRNIHGPAHCLSDQLRSDRVEVMSRRTRVSISSPFLPPRADILVDIVLCRFVPKATSRFRGLRNRNRLFAPVRIELPPRREYNET